MKDITINLTVGYGDYRRFKCIKKAHEYLVAKDITSISYDTFRRYCDGVTDVPMWLKSMNFKVVKNGELIVGKGLNYKRGYKHHVGSGHVIKYEDRFNTYSNLEDVGTHYYVKYGVEFGLSNTSLRNMLHGRTKVHPLLVAHNFRISVDGVRNKIEVFTDEEVKEYQKLLFKKGWKNDKFDYI